MNVKKSVFPAAAMVLLFGLLRPGFAQEQMRHIRTAIHINSTVSEGRLSLEEIAQTARENGIGAVIYTDRSIMKWEYGVWPFRGLVHKTVEHPSVFKYGIDRYLRKISDLDGKYPNLILMPGIEAAPFYYWEGSPLDENMKMYHWHRHLLAIGMEDPSDYENIPVAGNPAGLRTHFRPILLWPLVTLACGIFCFFKRKYNYTDTRGRSLGPYSKWWRTAGTAVTIVSVMFLLGNWPYYDVRFDQYHGDREGVPYQNFIDYVDSRGGITFWAHPEAANISELKGVSFETLEHSEMLLQTTGYTGFAMYYEGYRRVGGPGGIWDDVLKEYCLGLRDRPAWAIAGMAFDKGDLAGRMKYMQNVVLTHGRSRGALLAAMRAGRMYICRGSGASTFVLERFSVSDEAGTTEGISGDTVAIRGAASIHVAARYGEPRKGITVTILRDGREIARRIVDAPFNLTHRDDTIGPVKSYYRVLLGGGGVTAVTNPIFVEFEADSPPLPESSPRENDNTI